MTKDRDEGPRKRSAKSDVESSRVNLVMPHDSLFTSDQRDAKASVVLTLRRRSISADEATAIRNLVAAAVDDLSPANVTLVDASGQQLGQKSASEQDEGHEQELASKLIQTLEPVAGEGSCYRDQHHVAELVRRHAWELLGRAETKRLLDSLNDSHPRLVEELVPKLLTLGEVQRVLQQLLREQVSVRDLGSILEALVEVAATTKSLPQLVEAARQALGRRVLQPLLEPDGSLRVWMLDPALEEEIAAQFQPENAVRLLGDGRAASAPPLRRLADSLKQLMGAHASSASPVLLCQSPARYHLRRWLEPIVPRVAVIAPAEIPPEIHLRSAGVVR